MVSRMTYFNKRSDKGHSLIKVLGDYTVLDIETTSLDSFHGEIIEISALKVREKKKVASFSELIHIDHEIGYFTTRLTGITQEMLEEGKDLEEVLGCSLSNDYVDTLRLSRKLLPDLKHHKLDDLIAYFHLPKRKEHRALNDCLLTNEVYLRLGEMLKDSV